LSKKGVKYEQIVWMKEMKKLNGKEEAKDN